MAAFHQRLAGERRDGVSPGLGQRHEAIAHLLRGGFDALERAIEPAADLPQDEARPMALRWLTLARAIAPQLLEPLREAAGRTVPLQPCLRDARPEHFLFEGDRVTGLVNFGAMGVDCVAGDLARLMGDWLDGDPSARAEALAAYERIRPLDRRRGRPDRRLRVVVGPAHRRALDSLALHRRPPVRRPARPSRKGSPVAWNTSSGWSAARPSVSPRGIRRPTSGRSGSPGPLGLVGSGGSRPWRCGNEEIRIRKTDRVLRKPWLQVGDSFRPLSLALFSPLISLLKLLILSESHD